MDKVKCQQWFEPITGTIIITYICACFAIIKSAFK